MKKKVIILLIILFIFIIIISFILYLKYNYCYTIKDSPYMDPEVASEISLLFAKNQKILVYLKNNEANINKGVSYGIAFAIKNVLDSDANFSYYINNIDNNCDIDKYKSLDIIKSNKNFDISINKKGSYTDIIRFDAPFDFPNCIIQYQINVDVNGTNYDRYNFSIDISKKPKFNLKTWFCQSPANKQLNY